MGIEELVGLFALSQFERAVSRVIRAPEEIVLSAVPNFRKLRINRFYKLGKRGMSETSFLNGISAALATKKVEHLGVALGREDGGKTRVLSLSITKGDRHQVSLTQDFSSLLKLLKSQKANVLLLLHTHVGSRASPELIQAVVEHLESTPSQQDRATTENLKVLLESAGVRLQCYVVSPDAVPKRVYLPSLLGSKATDTIRAVVTSDPKVGEKALDFLKDALLQVVREYGITLKRTT